MISRHLLWHRGSNDKLVSWTSSLLYALVYVFHLHAYRKNGSAFGDTYLCVVDTSSLLEGVFVRGMDLVEAYQSFDDSLRGLGNLRRRKHRISSGYFYFGEYLSQGALKIEGSCQIVSSRDIIDRGLRDIRPEFAEFEEWKPQQSPPWENTTIELREAVYSTPWERQGIGTEGLKVALEISDLFGPQWKLPMTASFVALAPLRGDMRDILLVFRPPIFEGQSDLGQVISQARDDR
ncbi:hypothetical protein FSARC_571 [Fusarium sarcochroum]|uniref:Uncharacterized protein n=1 Tax=Fusarium sarcochroum TaxID=1208366 RepID=A0A8H4XG89_9HYPO|nr:hypothetical protein FSARC_571 [Fusarium sarcochroum]